MAANRCSQTVVRRRGDGVEEEMEVAEKEARLEEAYEEGRREGFQGLGPGGMGMEEMDELEEQARRTGGAPRMEGGASSEPDGKGGESAMPVMAGLSMELPSKGGTTVQPKGAGLSGELPKTGSGNEGLSGELPKTGSANKEDEDGETDRAAGERQEAERRDMDKRDDGGDKAASGGMEEGDSDPDGGNTGTEEWERLRNE